MAKEWNQGVMHDLRMEGFLIMRREIEGEPRSEWLRWHRNDSLELREPRKYEANWLDESFSWPLRSAFGIE